MKLRDLIAGSMSRASVSRRRATNRKMRCEPLEGRIALASYTAGTVPELIAAIDSANLSPEDDEITLTAPSYSLTESHATPESWARITPNGALTINGEGATIARDTSSETPAFRLFEVDPGATLHLNDQTLTGGLATKPPGPGTALGGAVLNRGALWLNGVTLDGNTAQGPDGKHLFGVPGTAGGARGGGVYSDGYLNVQDSTFTNNVARGGKGHDGITTYGDGPMSQPGGAGGDGLGGGVFVAGGGVYLSGVSFTSNAAIGGDGGKGLDVPKGNWNYGITPGGDAGDGRGGGIYIADGAATLVSVQAVNNNAQRGLAGIGGKHGRKRAPNGKPGEGAGGGISINELAIVKLDTFTKKNVKSNTASTGAKNIAGSYSLIS